MLVSNLIENAVKYAPSGGKVTIKAEGSTLQVINSFPQTPVLDIDKLFEPFYRPDESRSGETGGNGLGLAICKSIASANEWSISLKQEETAVVALVRFDLL